MQPVRPKKGLGQHFLTDLGIARRIAATLEPWKDLPVLEVGPGTGVLTQFLLQDGYDTTVVEIDTESVDYLKVNYPELYETGRIKAEDFLEMDLHDLYPQPQKFCIIGNYPYNISSQIFFKVLDYKDQVVACSGMLQREVAQRLAAGPGTKTRGILSVLLQLWYDVEYLFTVDEKVFNPPPKVKSGVVLLKRNNVTDPGCDERLFKTVIKTSFGMRRKTLRNSLKPILPPGVQLPEDIGAMRPEQLSVEQFVSLTNFISQARAGASKDAPAPSLREMDNIKDEDRV